MSLFIHVPSHLNSGKNIISMETRNGKANVFSITGLRTLCVAVTTITPDFYEEWKEMYLRASTSVQNREKKLEEAAELIERVCLSLFFARSLHYFAFFSQFFNGNFVFLLWLFTKLSRIKCWMLEFCRFFHLSWNQSLLCFVVLSKYFSNNRFFNFSFSSSEICFLDICTSDFSAFTVDRTFNCWVQQR